MAAAAVPVVEAAVVALLRALGIVGVGVVGGKAVNDQLKARAQKADESSSLPIAQAGTEAQTKKKCDKCPPDAGSSVTRNWNMSADARAYQARITGFPPSTEWNFEGVDFDGFKSAACLLLEAKARYDQFFLTEGPDKGQPKFFFRITGAVKIMDQAENQSAVVWASPPAKLNWHFMQPISYAYFSLRFATALLPIVCFNTP